jgi:NAD(P)-dependent dehydrogenase (short-subunit alcohol dehydrogenase family)
MTPVRELFSLQGRTALVTGGSRGLGLQMAMALGEQGAAVVISARKAAGLDAAVAARRALGNPPQAVVADLAAPAGAVALACAAIGRLGHVDILVNNAGTGWAAPAEDTPLDAWDKVMNLNVRGVFLLTQAVGRRSMIPRRTGSIVNIASIAGLAGNPPGTMKTLAYNTSKGAIVNFTRTLAGEWGAYGINVNAIAPGFFPSKMTHGLLTDMGERLAADAPLGRLGGDDDLKGAVVLFASRAGRHITGQILAIDGGVSAV